MYQDTVTFFNRKKLADRTKGSVWYPTVLKGVNLNIDRASIVAQYGPESQDNAVLNVRYQRNGDGILVGGKPWMPPKEWDGTEDSLTFAVGDFFWVGEWGDSIPEDVNYDGGFYGYMNDTHDFVFMVTSVSMLSLIPHFEIVGK